MAPSDPPPADRSLFTADTTHRLPNILRSRPERLIRVVYSPDEELQGRTFTLDGSTYEWGRQVDGAGRVRDRHMSRRHFRLMPRDEDYFVVDLGAANGTFVDGAPVSESTHLPPGAVISAGQTLFVDESELNSDALPAAPDADGDLVHEIVGVSTLADRLRQAIATVARSSGSVLILGPTGAGKEVTAQALHRLSRRAGRLVAVNCAAIPPNLAEAEFFGHRKGAFTGAETDRDGYFVQAHEGTLFLDEVGDLPVSMQAKLLRVLEDQTVHPVGGGESMQVDARILAATLIDLDTAGFRRDLLARLGTWVLKLPSLGARRSDILPLWHHFTAMGGGHRRPMSAAFAEALVLHDWPLNVRELLNTVRRVNELAPSEATLELEHLPAAFREAAEARAKLAPLPSGGAANATSIEDTVGITSNTQTIDGAPSRIDLLERVRSARGNVKQVAIDGGWHRTQVYRWIKRYEIDVDAYR